MSIDSTQHIAIQKACQDEPILFSHQDQVLAPTLVSILSYVIFTLVCIPVSMVVSELLNVLDLFNEKTSQVLFIIVAILIGLVIVSTIIKIKKVLAPIKKIIRHIIQIKSSQFTMAATPSKLVVLYQKKITILPWNSISEIKIAPSLFSVILYAEDGVKNDKQKALLHFGDGKNFDHFCLILKQQVKLHTNHLQLYNTIKKDIEASNYLVWKEVNTYTLEGCISIFGGLGFLIPLGVGILFGINKDFFDLIMLFPFVLIFSPFGFILFSAGLRQLFPITTQYGADAEFLLRFDQHSYHLIRWKKFASMEFGSNEKTILHVNEKEKFELNSALSAAAIKQFRADLMKIHETQ
ncbi:MAG: hypothetical protein MUF42_13850 [Cytophagaceae bacterium]|jgi:hypothetical protein|nr:hypothetical protein [Cytophagaceae bacterium]